MWKTMQGVCVDRMRVERKCCFHAGVCEFSDDHNPVSRSDEAADHSNVCTEQHSLGCIKSILRNSSKASPRIASIEGRDSCVGWSEPIKAIGRRVPCFVSNFKQARVDLVPSIPSLRRTKENHHDQYVRIGATNRSMEDPTCGSHERRPIRFHS